MADFHLWIRSSLGACLIDPVGLFSSTSTAALPRSLSSLLLMFCHSIIDGALPAGVGVGLAPPTNPTSRFIFWFPIAVPTLITRILRGSSDIREVPPMLETVRGAVSPATASIGALLSFGGDSICLFSFIAFQFSLYVLATPG